MPKLAAGDSLLPIDPPSNTDFVDPHIFHDDFYSHCGGLASEIDLDIDFDGIDWDISVDDLLLPEVPDSFSKPSYVSTDGSPPESGVSTTSSFPGTSGDINVHSPESRHSANCSDSGGKVKRDEERSGWGTKRKKEREEVSGNSNPNPRSRKFRRSEDISSCVFSAGSEEEEKRKARLMRNRESAQLSRLRKKNYVEELEEKIRSMQSTITELNSKISFIMVENSSLKQQLGGGPGGPPPSVAPIHFPWVPYPGLAFRPQGSLVPLVPIPKLRSQQAATTQKTKKTERKNSGSKNRKVASITFLGLMFFVLIFGGLIGRVDNNYKESRVFRVVSIKDGLKDDPCGMVWGVNGHTRSLNNVKEDGSHVGNKTKAESGMNPQNGKLGSEEDSWSSDRHKFLPNSSESLPALLYVPRNGKHVKINGNLIISSVLASEKAVTQVKYGNHPKQRIGTEIMETSLAITRSVPSGVALSARDIVEHTKSYGSSVEHHRALSSDAEDKYMGTSRDGPLQQWFREGLAGPTFSSATCTEVFQFEISPSSSSSTSPGAIVTAPSTANNTTDAARGSNSSSSSTPKSILKNRRFLYPQAIPLPGSTTLNNAEQIGKPTQGNNNASAAPPMIVSVLADPREVADADTDGMVSPPNKALPRIFVVVLLDSVKYVTYSCVLPFKNPNHMVNY